MRGFATPLLTGEEVAEALRVTPRQVKRWAATGAIERVRLGHRTARYTAASVEEFIAKNTTTPEGNPGPAYDSGGGAARSDEG